MNLLGRLFIVLIFVGSVTLMAWSVMLYATHTNWREVANKKDQELKQKTQDLANLQKEMADMQAALELEVRSQVNRNVALKAKVDQLTQDNTNVRDELASLKAELENRITVADTALKETGLLRARLEEASKRLLESQNDWMIMSTQLVSKMDEAHSLAIQVATYQAVSAQLAQDYREAVEVLRRLGVSADLSLYASQPPTGIRGVITQVRPGGVVEISVGADSGLVKGHQLDVVRNRAGNTSYVGKIEITNVAADRAAARIMPEFRRGTIQRDDEVTYIDVNTVVAH